MRKEMARKSNFLCPVAVTAYLTLVTRRVAVYSHRGCGVQEEDTRIFSVFGEDLKALQLVAAAES